MDEIELDQAEAVDSVYVACEGRWVYTEGAYKGKCSSCYQEVPYSKQEVQYSTGRRMEEVPEPHKRISVGYLIADVGECSCGGFHGALGTVERVSCLREKMATAPTDNCGKCGKSWSAHVCPE